MSGCAPGGDSAAAHADYVEQSAQLPELRQERTNRVIACMADAGFPGLTAGADGTTQASIPQEQADAYDVAAAACYQEVCTACGQPLSRAAWERLYSLQVEAMRCVREQGYEVSDAPSVQTYLGSPEDQRWSPHREIAQQPGAHLGEPVEKMCPDPENFVSYWSER